MNFDFTLLEYFIIVCAALACLSIFDLVKNAIKEGFER